MSRNKKIGFFLIFTLIAVVAYGGVKLTEPSYSLTMDVNPSIEIVSNRLDKVVEVNPLNEDAEGMLKDFELDSKELKDTIVDLADLMVLTGYISGGEDNLVMITVDDDDADKDVLDELNRAISAYLENKQIEATIVNQSISKQVGSGKTGKEKIIQRISELDDDLKYNDAANMTLAELIRFVESKDIAPEDLFTELIRTANSNTNNTNSKGSKEFIGEEKAKEIALAKVNGEIVEFELDDTDDDGDDNPEYEIEIVANGYKYEIEIDAYTGKILEFEKDDLDDDYRGNGKSESKLAAKQPAKKQLAQQAASPAPKQESQQAPQPAAQPSKPTLIGDARAKEIALEKTGGGTVVEFELDWDDGTPEYEIEIKKGEYEYEIEIDGYTGKILGFEIDD